MRLLDRYLLRELLTPLAYCLGGFLIFWISWDLFTELQEMQERKLHLFDVICYSIAMTPEFLVTVLPVGLLLALLYTLTIHARHNEITAMRAAGVSLWRVCVPYLVVGLTASIALFALNEICVPRSTAWAERILNRYVHKPDNAKDQFHGFTNERNRRSWWFKEYRSKAEEMIGQVWVRWTLPDGLIRTLRADRAVYTNGVWTFFNVTELEQTNEKALANPYLTTNTLVMPQFEETPADIQNELTMSKYENLHSRKLNIPLVVIWDYLRLHPNLKSAEANRLLTKFHGRLAEPWTCLVVVLIAIPFGAASGRRNLFVGVAGSIFICFAFFVIQQLSLAFGSGGYLPGWLAAWLPNLVFGVTGLTLIARVR